jgi:hypothetical protein
MRAMPRILHHCRRLQRRPLLQDCRQNRLADRFHLIFKVSERLPFQRDHLLGRNDSIQRLFKQLQ